MSNKNNIDLSYNERLAKIEEQAKEIERLKKAVTKKVEIAVLEGERDHKEIERLKKEREWLLSRYVKDSYVYIYYPHMEMKEIRSSVETEMQQALKEK